MPKLKLTMSEKEEGRTLLASAFSNHSLEDLENFYIWVTRTLFISEKLTRQCWNLFFVTYNSQKALELYDNIVENYHPVRDLLRGLFFITLRALLICGIIGGIIYLVKDCQ